MSALKTYCAAVSKRADKMLELHHEQLFGLGLDVIFNRATLATKYWLPLPESDVPAQRTDAPENEYPPNESEEQLFAELRECERILQRFEESYEKSFERLHERLLERGGTFESPVEETINNLYAIG